MIMHIKGISTAAYSGKTNSSVRRPMLLHCLLIISRQQLTDTLQPPSTHFYRDQRPVICNICSAVHFYVNSIHAIVRW